MKYARIFLAWLLLLGLILGLTTVAGAADNTPLTVTRVVELEDRKIEVYFSEPITLNSANSMGICLINQAETSIPVRRTQAEYEAKWQRNIIANPASITLAADGSKLTFSMNAQYEAVYYAETDLGPRGNSQYKIRFFIQDLAASTKGNGQIDAIAAKSNPAKKLTANASVAGTDYALATVEYKAPYLKRAEKVGSNQYRFVFSEPVTTTTNLRPTLAVVNKSDLQPVTRVVGSGTANWVQATSGSGFTLAADGLSLTVTFDAAWITAAIREYLAIGPDLCEIQVRLLEASSDTNCYVDIIKDKATGTEMAMAEFNNSAGADALIWDVSDVTCPVATVGSTNYYTLADALSAAGQGQTVSLYRDYANIGQTLIIPSGITLDLNGHILNAPQFLSFGDVVDSRNGQGLLIHDKTTDDFTLLQLDNSHLPLYDAAAKGYRLFAYDIVNAGHKEVTTDTTVTSIKLGVRLTFSNPEAYRLLAQTEQKDLTLSYDLHLQRADSTPVLLRYTFTERILKNYANAVLSQTGNTIVLQVHGIDTLTEQSQAKPISSTFAATASITSVTGMTHDATQEAYHVGHSAAQAAVSWVRQHIIDKDLISFSYNGTKANLSNWSETISGQATTPNADWTQIRTYTKDGITLTLTISFNHKHAALEWMVDWDYSGSGYSKRISDVRILDALFEIQGAVMTTANQGGQNYFYDYQPYSVDLTKTPSYTMQNSGGRSSQGAWPYFDLTSGHNTYGIVGAIGWTGNWSCEFAYQNGSVNVSAGMQSTNYQMAPGEHLRTPSMVIQFFKGTQDDGHNAWRQLILDDYTPNKAYSDEKVTYSPISFNTWGGVGSDALIETMNQAKASGQYFEYQWIDAGWYGNAVSSAQADTWADQVGNWYYNPGYPNTNGQATNPDTGLYLTGGGFEALKAWHANNGTGLIVWFEPGRATASSQMGTSATKNNPLTFTATYKETPTSAPKTETVSWHNGYFLRSTSVVNYGNEEALRFIKAVVLHYLDDMNCEIYRQDYNFNPEIGWANEDSYNAPSNVVRTGISEIQYVMGHYELLDAILATGRQIDNCASGGRLLDIEMMKRSIPLWRTDYTVSGPSIASGVRSQGANLSWWLPISGSAGSSQGYNDAYGFRSYMASGATMGSIISNQTFAAKMIEEMKTNRELMLGDYYILQQGLHEGLALGTDTNHGNVTCWLEQDASKDYTDVTNAAYEFYREDLGKGYLVAFRPGASTVASNTFLLKGLDGHATYKVTDADTGAVRLYSGRHLMEQGLKLSFATTRSSHMIYFEKQ